MTDLSLCLIVKNEERLLRRCLEHFAPLADEIIVLDTGSTDSTMEQAKRFPHERLVVLRSQYFTATTPAEEFHFAQARNECVSYAKCGWIMSVDADDVIGPKNRERLMRLLTDKSFRLTTADGEGRAIGWFNSFRFAYRAGHSEMMTLRMFRNGRGNRYRWAVHECATADAPCGACRDIVIEHMPLPGEDVAAKGEWYLTMLRKDIARHPDDAALRFNFAKTFYDLKRWAEAVEAFEGFLGMEPGDEARFWGEMLLAGALFGLERLDEAEPHARRAMDVFGGHAQPRCLLGDIAAKRGDWLAARQWFRAAANTPLPQNAIMFVNRFYHEEYPRRRLAKVEQHAGPFRPGDERTLCVSCGDRAIEGAKNVTIDGRGLKQPWSEGTFNRVVADGVADKFFSPVAVMNALWDLADDGAEVVVRVARTPSVAAARDPYAKSQWNEQTFWYFQRGNPYHEKYRRLYGIRCSFNVRCIRVEGDWVVAELEAVKSERRDTVSIIVLNWNTAGITRECIEAVRRHVMHPHEVILIDNGSTESGTEQWAGLEGVRFVRNAENIGFARGCNQGANMARGDLVLFLNSDCIADRDFVAPMARLLLSKPRAGAVGPYSDYAAPPQGCYRREEWAEREDTLLGDKPMLVGFCLLMRREVFLRVGGFDEGFELGGFEDFDLSLRLRAAGCEQWLCGSAWVHHLGHQTFLKNGIPDPCVTEGGRNRERFEGKWGGNAARVRAAERSGQSSGAIAEKDGGGV